MSYPPFTGRCRVAALALLPLFSATALAQTPPPSGPPAAQGSVSLDLDIIAKQLDIARGQIQPSLGATVYEFRRDTIDAQPQGDNAPFNQLLLQAPGVAQDSFGQLHVRGDHANLQFRLNRAQLSGRHQRLRPSAGNRRYIRVDPLDESGNYQDRQSDNTPAKK